MLILERRTELVIKTALAIFLLKEDKEEKIAYLKQERRNLIHNIKELPDRPLFNEFINVMDKQRHLVHSYAELFKDILRKGLQLISEDEKLYKHSVDHIESLLNSSEKNKMVGLINSDLFARKDELLNLPKIRPLTDILVLLHYLDLLYKNLYAVRKDRPIVTSISEENSTVQLIRDFFNDMIEESNDGKSPFFKTQDYDFYVDLLTMYFEKKQYDIEDKTIEVKLSIKTKFGSTLGRIHERFKGTRNAEPAFFNIIRVLKPFKDDSNRQIQKAIRRKY